MVVVQGVFSILIIAVGAPKAIFANEEARDRFPPNFPTITTQPQCPTNCQNRFMDAAIMYFDCLEAIIVGNHRVDENKEEDRGKTKRERDAKKCRNLLKKTLRTASLVDCDGQGPSSRRDVARVVEECTADGLDASLCNVSLRRTICPPLTLPELQTEDDLPHFCCSIDDEPGRFGNPLCGGGGGGGKTEAAASSSHACCPLDGRWSCSAVENGGKTTFLCGGLFVENPEGKPCPLTPCTRELQRCADGSMVPRVGPRCEFASCPNEQPGEEASRAPPIGQPLPICNDTDTQTCPDGIHVVRRDPFQNCEFQKCPTQGPLSSGGGGGDGAAAVTYCPADMGSCPDGSYVPRDATNNCEYKPCPGMAPADPVLLSIKEKDCKSDTLKCKDGTRVARDPENNCEFEDCPDTKED